MKKIKVLLMMAALATMLCACSAGDSKAQLADGDSELMSSTETEMSNEAEALEVAGEGTEVLEVSGEETEEVEMSGTGAEEPEVSGAETEALDETQVEGAESSDAQTEASDTAENQENGEGVEQLTFECLPEILNASVEDCLIQIDNTIIRDDQTMTLNEVMTALQNSGVKYTFMIDDNEYSQDMSVAAGAMVTVEAYKNEEFHFAFDVINESDKTVKMSDEAVIFDGMNYYTASFAQNNYYHCKGILRSQDGRTYQTIKELFKEYEDIFMMKQAYLKLAEDNYQKIVEVTFSVETENSLGETICIDTSLFFDPEDKSCIAMYYDTQKED